MALHHLVIDSILNAACSRIRQRASRRGIGSFFIPANDLIGVRVFSTGTFENRDIEGLRQLIFGKLSQDECAIDVGANIGIYTVELARRFRRILAVEANPITFNVLRANIALSGCANVTAINNGLSNEEGVLELQVPSNGNLGWSTFRRWDMPGGSTSHKVSMVKLDDVVKSSWPDRHSRVAFVKVDVEGFEPQVLAGSKEVISAHRPVLFVESGTGEQGAEMRSLLASLGYEKLMFFDRKLFGKVSLEPVTNKNFRYGFTMLAVPSTLN